MLTKTSDTPVHPAATGARDPETDPAAARLARMATSTCTNCGHVLRVTGQGRHRVYFPLTDERLDDPVMDRSCPGCGHKLPGK